MWILTYTKGVLSLAYLLDVDLSQEAPTHRGVADDLDDDLEWLKEIDESSKI